MNHRHSLAYMALCVLWASCAHSEPGVPSIGPEIKSVDGNVYIDLHYCDEEPSAPQVLQMKVYAVDLRGEPTSLMCALVADKGAKPLATSWGYGAYMAGFSVENCRDLMPGGAYMVTVLGSGAGSQRFRLDLQRRVQALPPATNCGSARSSAPK